MPRSLVTMAWRDVVFLHWPVAESALRPQIPADLELDTYDGAAWVSIVAFRIARARPPGFPSVLGMRAFGEVNVRTYVTGPRMAGVWFLSLDADSALTVAAGRALVHLPYFRAHVDAAWSATGARYRSQRRDARAAAARFAVQAGFAGAVRTAAPGGLDHWLVERYCLYTVDARGRTLRGDVDHQPWLLRDAAASIERNDLLQAAGIAVAAEEPLVHVSPGVTARSWMLQPMDAPYAGRDRDPQRRSATIR